MQLWIWIFTSTLNDSDNLDDFKDTCINTAIDAISATLASSSKNSDYDGMIAFSANQVHEARVH
jgi:hypothetical protein